MKPERNFGYIQVTRKCNRECVFCSNPYVEDELSYEEAKKQIDEYKKEGVNEIVFTGGEPTLNEHLPELIKYCHSSGVDCRIITNAQKLADAGYAKKLAEAGLDHIMVSIYSHKQDVEEKLTKTKGSFDKTIQGIKNVIKYLCIPNINITINSLNADCLYELIKFIDANFPEIKHFVFNNIDYTGNALENKWVVPRLVDFELSLYKALSYLQEKNKTFRVERVPLCYMQGFEEFSTETRKIVKNQVYRCLFLDKAGRQLRKISNFYYEKCGGCELCSLNILCAGLNQRYSNLYGFDEPYPVFRNPLDIIKKIKD